MQLPATSLPLPNRLTGWSGGRAAEYIPPSVLCIISSNSWYHYLFCILHCRPYPWERWQVHFSSSIQRQQIFLEITSSCYGYWHQIWLIEVLNSEFTHCSCMEQSGPSHSRYIQTCLCRRSFSHPAAFKNHQNSCAISKQILSNALNKARTAARKARAHQPATSIDNPLDLQSCVNEVR